MLKTGTTHQLHLQLLGRLNTICRIKSVRENPMFHMGFGCGLASRGDCCHMVLDPHLRAVSAEPAPWASRAPPCLTLSVRPLSPKPTHSALQAASGQSTRMQRCAAAINVAAAAPVVPAASQDCGSCSTALAVGGTASQSRTDGLRAAGYATPTESFEAALGCLQGRRACAAR